MYPERGGHTELDEEEGKEPPPARASKVHCDQGDHHAQAEIDRSDGVPALLRQLCAGEKGKRESTHQKSILGVLVLPEVQVR